MPSALFPDQTCLPHVGGGGEAGGRKQGEGPSGPSPSPHLAQTPDDLPYIPNRAAWRRALRKQLHADAPPPARPYSPASYPQCFRGVFAVFLTEDFREVHLAPLTCGKWSCPDCSDRKVARAIAQMLAGDPERHLTLTTRPRPGMRYDHAVKWLRKCFAKLITRARKVWGPQQYFMVPEPHASGWPHLHVLLRGSYIARLWVKRNWADITGSPNIDIKVVRSAPNAARDLAKYLSKSAPILAAFPTKLRPFTHSKGWLPTCSPTVTAASGPSRPSSLPRSRRPAPPVRPLTT